MNKIKNIYIKNLKILKELSLELGDLTLITGINSSGKSTFIQALLLLKQNQELINKVTNNYMLEASLKNLDDEVKSNIQNMIENTKNTPININGEYITIGDKKDFFHQDIYEEDMIISLDVESLKKVEYHINYHDLTIDTSLKIPLNNVLNIFADDFQYIHTDRLQPNSIYTLSNTHIRNNNIGNHGEYTAHYLDEYRRKPLRIEALKHPQSKTEQFLENVSFWLSEISNGVGVIPKRHQDIQKASLSYQYTYGNNTTNEYTPLNVGFGITYVLPIIVAILKSKPDDLLIIENPESHLHPAGQSKIAELCARASSNGVQIIIETHSDHFLNGIRVATKKAVLQPEQSKIYYFEKEDQTISTKIHKLTIDGNGKINENWPNGFFDEYDKQLDELIAW